MTQMRKRTIVRIDTPCRCTLPLGNQATWRVGDAVSDMRSLHWTTLLAPGNWQLAAS